MKAVCNRCKYFRKRDKLAWAAGFFDGEGCVGLKRTRGRPYLMATVCQKGRPLLDRFRRIIGFGNLTGPRLNGMYYLQFQNSIHVLQLYEMLAPYLGPVKQAQFHYAFRAWFARKQREGRVRPSKST